MTFVIIALEGCDERTDCAIKVVKLESLDHSKKLNIRAKMLIESNFLNSGTAFS